MTTGDPDTVVARAAEMLDAGLDGLIFNMPDAHDTDAVALVGETLAPLLAARQPARLST